MVFSSMTFLLVFLPLISMFYFMADKKFKNLILLVFSLIFYAWGEPKYIILMVLSIIINYFIGLIIDKYSKDKKVKITTLICAIIINIGLLIYFKYYNFGIGIVNGLFHLNISLKDIVLPIGISFYTFQILSYVIDLYRGTIKVQKNIFNLALYVSFFPQLIAGPIVKYKDIEKEINDRKTSIEDLNYGIKRFVYGLSKKVLLANTLALTADYIFDSELSALNTPIMWLGAICYTLQIYFDFSGYSDMAIGLGRIFGFHFNENFNYPYISKSITEFWRRWHISLSTWFKEYIYIPLGGNRKGKYRTYINLMIVFLTTGLWHGASWNFVCWGIYYGIFLIIERIFLKKYLDKYVVLPHIYTIFLFILGWVMFRAPGMKYALDLYKLMFSFDFSSTYLYSQYIFNGQFIFILIISILMCGPVQVLSKVIFEKNKDIQNKLYKLENIFVILLFILCLLDLSSNGYNPFIYFRF